MNWNRHGAGMKNTRMYIDVLVFSLILCFLFKQYILVTIISFLLIVALLQIIYYHRVGKRFEFVNEKKEYA